jgi:hypothetical protein
MGARNPAQVVGWINAANLELTSGDLDEIATAIQQTGAGSGPLRPRQKIEAPELTISLGRTF